LGKFWRVLLRICQSSSPVFFATIAGALLLTATPVRPSNQSRTSPITIIPEVAVKNSAIELQSLAARVEKLESQNRRWKLASALFSLFGVAFLLMGAKPADSFDKQVIRAGTIEAQQFVLKDEDGHVYARLSLNATGRAVQLNGRVYLVPSQKLPGEPGLQFYDDKGNVVWTAPSRPELMTVR
jgi:hypothetical protein